MGASSVELRSKLFDTSGCTTSSDSSQQLPGGQVRQHEHPVMHCQC